MLSVSSGKSSSLLISCASPASTSRSEPSSRPCSDPSTTALPRPEITYTHWSLSGCRLSGPPVAVPGASTIVAACERRVPASNLKPDDGSTCTSSTSDLPMVVTSHPPDLATPRAPRSGVLRQAGYLTGEPLQGR